MAVGVDAVTESSVAQLRAALIAGLGREGWIRSPGVAAAFAAVPREKVAPGSATPAQAYAMNGVIVTKRDAGGRAMSSVSAPWLQADMLEEARLGPGDRVLEIGSGGCNAAMMDVLVGATGQVTTIDIDPEVVDRAGRFLAETGRGERVRLVCGDAEHAAAVYAPYDAIIVTVGVWDCPWGDLLAPGGRIVIPLRFPGGSRSITFVRDGDRLVGERATMCGFVPVQGAGAHHGSTFTIAAGTAHLETDGDRPDLDADALDRALQEPRTERWSGIPLARMESFDTFAVWLACVDDTSVLVSAPQADTGPVRPAIRWQCPALATGDSFAYLATRDGSPPAADDGYEFGIHAYGPDREELAQRMLGHLQTWNREHRGVDPSFTLHPAGATVPAPATGRIWPKHHTQLAVAWPGAARPAAARGC